MSIYGAQGKRRESNLDSRCFPLRCFQNAWYECFFTHHNLSGKDDLPAVQIRKVLGDMEDILEILLQTSGNSGSPSEADEVKRFCKGGPALEVLQQGVGEVGSRRAAWVDDRNSPHLSEKGRVRLRGTWLTATGLLRHLSHPVWDF